MRTIWRKTKIMQNYIDKALGRTRGNRQAAARMLGVKRTTLVAKLALRRKSHVPAVEVREWGAGEIDRSESFSAA
jgi:DNA-binding NtrC family response regulator